MTPPLTLYCVQHPEYGRADFREDKAEALSLITDAPFGSQFRRPGWKIVEYECTPKDKRNA